MSCLRTANSPERRSGSRTVRLRSERIIDPIKRLLELVRVRRACRRSCCVMGTAEDRFRAAAAECLEAADIFLPNLRLRFRRVDHCTHWNGSPGVPTAPPTLAGTPLKEVAADRLDRASGSRVGAVPAPRSSAGSHDSVQFRNPTCRHSDSVRSRSTEIATLTGHCLPLRRAGVVYLLPYFPKIASTGMRRAPLW
jgi:hypothetical protein